MINGNLKIKYYERSQRARKKENKSMCTLYSNKSITLMMKTMMVKVSDFHHIIVCMNGS